MCGIVALAGRQEVEWISRMNGAIVHRGPDDQGIYRSQDQSVSLAMRRLSILDLEGGHQPMSDASGQIWIVFNGEIFNAPELRLRLERQGHQFRTKNSDTEVLLQLYLEKGPACLDDLNGMFAFVIHDRRKNVLFGARDGMGIKPLYYWHQGGRLACASELKALLQLPVISRDIDTQSLFHYMTCKNISTFFRPPTVTCKIRQRIFRGCSTPAGLLIFGAVLPPWISARS